MPKRGPVDLRQVANTSAIHKEFKPAVALAAKHGWTGRYTGAGGIQMVSPDRRANTYVPSSVRDGGTAAKKMIHTINKWINEQEEASVEDSLTKIAEGVGLEREDIEARHGTSPTISCKEHGVEFLSWEGLSEHVRNEHTDAADPISAAIRDAVTNTHEEEPVHEPEATSTPARMAASETVTPWLAIRNRKKDGTVNYYESDSVFEVTNGEDTWYRCAFPGCGFESAENPRSVKGHYAMKHVRGGEAEPLDSNARVVVSSGDRPAQYATKVAIDSLAREMYDAMRHRTRHKNEGMTAWCKALAEIILDARGETQVEPTETISKTDPSESETLLSQIVDLIRPQFAAEVDAAKALVEEANRGREEAEAKAARAVETLRAMAELASEGTE